MTETIPTSPREALLQADQPQIARAGILDCQACVPSTMTDEEALAFVESANPCGTRGGWAMRTDPTLLAGSQPRVQCEERPGCVHITFDA